MVLRLVLVASLAAFLRSEPAAGACVQTGKPKCNSCSTAVCVADGWECDPLADGTSCSDGNACTVGDTCQSGVCTGGPPVVCAGPSYDPQLHCNTEACNPSTGVCSAPSPTPGVACNDGSNATYNDMCDSTGHCGGTPVVCPASNTCVTYTAVGTATCQVTFASTSTQCSDTNACTGTAQSPDHCDGAGHCTAGAAVACTATDACHLAGSCSDNGGGQPVCSNPPAPDGTSCAAVNGPGATCTGGVCGMPPTQCNTGFSLCNGTCIPSSSCCSNADCRLASGEGEQTCVTSTHTCSSGAPACAAGYKLCGATCIRNDACCIDSDCPTGLSCSANACTLNCGPSMTVCGTNCVATGTGICCPTDNI